MAVRRGRRPLRPTQPAWQDTVISMKDMAISARQGPGGAPAAEGEELDLARMARALWNGRWWVVAVGLVALLAGGIYATRLAVPVHTATATLVLDTRGERVVDLADVAGGVDGDATSINTEIQVMRSRGLIEKLVRRLELTADPEFNASLRPEAFSLRREMQRGAARLLPALVEPPAPRGRTTPERQLQSAIDAARARLSVRNLTDSHVFDVTATTEDPATAAAMANTLADLYVLDQIEVKFEATAQATEWLTERVESLRVEFERAQDALRDFTARAELVTPEEIAALNRQIADLRGRLAALRGAAAGDSGAGPEAGPATPAADPRAAAVAARDWETLAALTGDRTLARLLDLPRSARNEAALAARAARLVPAAPPAPAPDASGTADAPTDRGALQARALAASLSDLEAELARRSTDLIERQALEREVEQSRVLYEYFQTRLRETAVQQGIQQADSRVLSRAVVPAVPSAPDKTLIMAASLLAGLMLGGAIVIAREMRHNGFRSAEELEAATGEVVMGQLPRAPINARKGLLAYLGSKPGSRLSEAFRNLRTSVMLSDLDRPPRVIMSTSSLPGEGKTTQALALAQNFSAMGKSVLLVEGDIRRRTLTRQLGLAREFGLLAVLSGEAELGHATQRHPELGTVAILSGDRSRTNPVDVFSSDSFARFLAAARAAYDIVIVDTPPVLAVPDARVIGQQADAVLYAVRWNGTPRSAVREGLRLLETVNVRVAGLVLTQIDLKGMERYGYGRYASYGKGYYRD